MQVSTMSHLGDLIAAGGFNGELVCYRLQGEGELVYAERITNRYRGACVCRAHHKQVGLVYTSQTPCAWEAHHKQLLQTGTEGLVQAERITNRCGAGLGDVCCVCVGACLPQCAACVVATVALGLAKGMQYGSRVPRRFKQPILQVQCRSVQH